MSHLGLHLLRSHNLMRVSRPRGVQAPIHIHIRTLEGACLIPFCLLWCRLGKDRLIQVKAAAVEAKLCADPVNPPLNALEDM